MDEAEIDAEGAQSLILLVIIALIGAIGMGLLGIVLVGIASGGAYLGGEAVTELLYSTGFCHIEFDPVFDFRESVECGDLVSAWLHDLASR